MAGQVLGLFTDEPRLDQPTTRPADLSQVLAGGAGTQPMGQPPAVPAPASAPQVNGLFGQAARGAAAGVGAASQAGPSYDGKSAALNIGAATLSGAAAGAAYGGPYGAAAGAVIGLAASSLQAWGQVSAKNKRKKDLAALTSEIEQKNQARDNRDRADSISQLKYDRKQAAFNKAWGVNAAQRDAITNLINQNSTLRARYLQSGVRSQYA